jgi:hypothetical protein
MKGSESGASNHVHATRNATRGRHRVARHTSVMLSLVVAAIAIAAPASAGAASSSTPNAIRVSGSGVRAASSAGDVPFTFSFNATTAALGHGATGTFSGMFPHDPAFPAPGNFSTFSGVVTCLQVNGDQATVGGLITSGYGYDDNFTSQTNLAGDWFITTVQDPKNGEPDTMGYNDYGDPRYFATQGFSTFDSLCDNPTGDIGTSQFPLLSGDITINNQ